MRAPIRKIWSATTPKLGAPREFAQPGEPRAQLGLGASITFARWVILGDLHRALALGQPRAPGSETCWEHANAACSFLRPRGYFCVIASQVFPECRVVAAATRPPLVLDVVPLQAHFRGVGSRRGLHADRALPCEEQIGSRVRRCACGRSDAPCPASLWSWISIDWYDTDRYHSIPSTRRQRQ